jgi:hypothetical protein
MSKNKKKPRRKKLRHPTLENLVARASGFAINENRRGTLVRLMDTAIQDWFLERDPFPIHLLVCASYMVLSDLGRKSGKGPIIEKHFGRFSLTAVYDFLRHATPDMLNDSVDFVPTVNEWMLFDAITSFENLFNCRTIYMQTFDAYYALHSSGRGAHPNIHKHAAEFLPKGISLEKAARLGRIAFFMEVSEMFAAEIELQATPSPPNNPPT